MPNTLDLNLMVIARQAGMDLVDLPGLYIADLPRNPARGRESDRLVLYLALTGQPLDPSERLSQILANLANTFYKSPGAVTSALRRLTESLNQTIYERNLTSPVGEQRHGLLTCFVLRGDQAVLAQCGAVKAILVTAQQSREFYDPDLNALGLTETPEIRYYQTNLMPSDSLLLCAQPPENWNVESLRIGHGQGPESVRRRLLSQATHDLSAILIQSRPGKGSIQQLRSAPAQGPMAMEGHPPETGEQAPVISPVPVGTQPGEAVWSMEQELQSASGEFTPWTEIPVNEAAAAAALGAGEGVPAGQAAPVETGAVAADESPEKRSVASCLLAPVLWVGGLLSYLVSGLARVVQAVLSRVLPEDTLASLSNTSMAVIAVLIPLLVVGVSSFIYFQRGLTVQSQLALEEAAAAAELARAQTDPLAQRQAWENTLQYLDQVDSYQSLPRAQELRTQALAAIDALNQIKRVDYRPAIVGGLPATVKVISMQVMGEDLYLLDGNSGSVLRATLTAQGYVLDNDFLCTPNTPSDSGPFVDSLSGSIELETAADVLSMDPAGNLLSCFIDRPPQPGNLQPPASRTLTRLAAFAQDFNYLYVLDPPANAVWVYPKGALSGEPRLYFDEYIPPMQDTIDLATAADELYLLHSDGHLTLCQTSNLDVSPTRCTEPAPFLDSRPGLVDTVLVPTNPYTQIQYSQPPDPALYLLEPTNQAIDLFSLQRLTFQRRYLPLEILSGGPATAYAVDTLNRTLFLAAGNNVYYGRMP